MAIQRRLVDTARQCEFASTSYADDADGPLTVACASDPDRWTTTADEGAKMLCRACPRRWLCAQDACRTPGAEGVWAGIEIPEGGRARQFALKQLRSLAEHNGRTPRNGTNVA